MTHLWHISWYCMYYRHGCDKVIWPMSVIYTCYNVNRPVISAKADKGNALSDKFAFLFAGKIFTKWCNFSSNILLWSLDILARDMSYNFLQHFISSLMRYLQVKIFSFRIKIIWCLNFVVTFIHFLRHRVLRPP